jgi:hypothetical protein
VVLGYNPPTILVHSSVGLLAGYIYLVVPMRSIRAPSLGSREVAPYSGAGGSEHTYSTNYGRRPCRAWPLQDLNSYTSASPPPTHIRDHPNFPTHIFGPRRISHMPKHLVGTCCLVGGALLAAIPSPSFRDHGIPAGKGKHFDWPALSFGHSLPLGRRFSKRI